MKIKFKKLKIITEKSRNHRACIENEKEIINSDQIFSEVYAFKRENEVGFREFFEHYIL